MSAALAIAQLAFAFYDRAVPLIQAGMDLSKEYSAHKARVEALANANQAPSPADWDAMLASLKPLEDSIQSAHRDAPGS